MRITHKKSTVLKIFNISVFFINSSTICSYSHIFQPICRPLQRRQLGWCDHECCRRVWENRHRTLSTFDLLPVTDHEGTG